MAMNEVEALKIKLRNSRTIFDVIDCCKNWREMLLRKVHIQLRTYQVPLSDRMIEYVVTRGASGNEIVSLWSRQSGKTEVVSLTVLVLGTFYLIFLNQSFSAGLFAPVESMITHVTRNRLRQRYRSIRPWLDKEFNIIQTAGEGLTASTFILERLGTEKEFTVRSLSVGESAEIIGPTFELMIIEQSELVNAMKLKNDVFPMGATTGGVRVLTGTTSPYFKNEYFRNAIEKWSIDPVRNRSTSDYVESVDAKQAARESTAYARYVSKERERLGEDSIEYKTQFGLEWVGTALKFIGWEKLTLLEQDYSWDRERLRFFGIDVARAGDSTVVTIIEINGTEIHIIGWLELTGLDFEKQLPLIIQFLYQYKPLRFGLIDVPGIGRPLYDMLKKRLWEETEDQVTHEVKREAWARLDGYYGSVKENDEVAKSLDMEFQHSRIFYPKHTEYKKEKAKFIDQLLDLERKYTGNTLKIEAPRIKGRHDDYPISLALAVHAFKEKSFRPGVRYLDI